MSVANGWDHVGVVGAGLMGAEIALLAAGPERRVTLVDIDDEALARGIEHARRAGTRLVERGHWTAEGLAERLAAIAPTTDVGALAGCALVVEAVPERLDLKKGVLRNVAGAVGAGAVVATNTSGLSITDLATSVADPARFVGLHFFNPATVMKLVEVIRGEGTDETVAAAAAAFARDLGKTPIQVRECPGFVVNRVLVRAVVAGLRAAHVGGIDPAQADADVIAGGPTPMGPHALADLVGIDTMELVRSDLERAYPGRYDDAGVLAALLAAGRLGRKSGGGFFTERPGETTGDPAGAAATAYYGAGADEARRVIAEQIASTGDVDTGMMLGAGWSAGPSSLKEHA